MHGESYVIFGANGGIGSATARRLREAGAQVLLAGRNTAALESLAADLVSPYQRVDATSFTEVDQALQEAQERFGGVSGVVNCVGSLLLKSAHLTSEDEWAATVAANLTSAFAVVRASSKAMRKTGGSIVLISSAAARAGLANHEAIAAAKAGVEGLTRSAAATYAAKNIRVNAIAPGLVRTGLTESIWANESAAKMSRGMHALGRLGEPDDVARAIVWLLDPLNGWTSGQVIGVDGGLAALRTASRV